MTSIKSALIFIVGFVILHILTYYIAGIIAQVGLGAGRYYPPSPEAIDFLRDPHSSYVQSLIIPAQSLRGFLFALVLLPFRRKIMQFGQYLGGLIITSILFIVGEIASSGGIIERFVYYTPIPLDFVVITFVEILIQTLLLGQLIMIWEKKFNKAFYSNT
ncbi:MAG: hypothetical protein QW667_03970 [Candidatus Bathyarchaeia archaeon]